MSLIQEENEFSGLIMKQISEDETNFQLRQLYETVKGTNFMLKCCSPFSKMFHEEYNKFHGFKEDNVSNNETCESGQLKCLLEKVKNMRSIVNNKEVEAKGRLNYEQQLERDLKQKEEEIMYLSVDLKVLQYNQEKEKNRANSYSNILIQTLIDVSEGKVGQKS
ncbi:hypothetical protein ABK040_012921 [Willaertia magna]